MVIKNSVWQKIQKSVYKQVECSDKSMDSLDIFLNDGLGLKPYITFLEDKTRIKFSGNISYIKKHGKMVTIEIDDYVYPDMPPFTTTIDNLITILKKFKRLENLEVNRIKIILDNDILTISED